MLILCSNTILPGRKSWPSSSFLTYIFSPADFICDTNQAAAVKHEHISEDLLKIVWITKVHVIVEDLLYLSIEHGYYFIQVEEIGIIV